MSTFKCTFLTAGDEFIQHEQRRMDNALCASLCPDPHFPTHHSTPNTSQRADTHTHAHLMTLNTHQKLFYFFATRVRAGGAVQRITFLIRFSHSLICYWSGWRGASPRHTTRCAPFHHSNLIKLSFKFNEKKRDRPADSWIRAYIFGVAKGRSVGAICISRLDCWLRVSESRSQIH